MAKQLKITWRCYYRKYEWRGETEQCEYFFRAIKVDGLWELHARGRAVLTPEWGTGYTTLVGAKKAAAELVAKSEGAR